MGQTHTGRQMERGGEQEEEGREVINERSKERERASKRWQKRVLTFKIQFFHSHSLYVLNGAVLIPKSYWLVAEREQTKNCIPTHRISDPLHCWIPFSQDSEALSCHLMTLCRRNSKLRLTFPQHHSPVWDPGQDTRRDLCVYVCVCTCVCLMGAEVANTACPIQGCREEQLEEVIWSCWREHILIG